MSTLANVLLRGFVTREQTGPAEHRQLALIEMMTTIVAIVANPLRFVLEKLRAFRFNVSGLVTLVADQAGVSFRLLQWVRPEFVSVTLGNVDLL